MDDEELIKEFIRAERRGNGVEITVCEIEWPTPSEPVSHWTVVTQLPLDASEAQIDTAVRSVLDDPRFSACARHAGSAIPTDGCTTLKCAKGALEPFTDTWTVERSFPTRSVCRCPTQTTLLPN